MKKLAVLIFLVPWLSLQAQDMSYGKKHVIQSKVLNEERTLPYRVYIGHSLGGLTSTYTLLHHPGVFDGYLAIDPSLWWDRAKYVNESPQSLNNFGTEKIQRFYLSFVDSPGQSNMSKSIHQLGFSLAANSPKNLIWKLDAIPDTDHSSIPLLSWYNGLLFVFQGFDMSHYGMMQDPDSIEKHFDELNNEPQKALEAYQEALRLNPGNETAKDKIEQLKDQK